jgi:hypothetical protein
LVAGVKSATVAPSSLWHAEETSGGYGADQEGNAPRIASLSALCRFTGFLLCALRLTIDEGAVCTFCNEWASMIYVETIYEIRLSLLLASRRYASNYSAKCLPTCVVARSEGEAE